MKRLALLAAVVLFAACAPKGEEAPAAETAAPAPAAPAVTDTAAPAPADTTAKTDSAATKAM